MKPLLNYGPVENKYVPEIVGWLNDPSVVKFSEQRFLKHTTETQRDYMEQMLGHVYLGVFLDVAIIGTISAYIDRYNLVANMGILIGDKACWGKGYGFKAWSWLTQLLFADSKLRKVEAGCMASNVGMMAICQKAGMVEEGRQEGHFMCSKGVTDLVHWGKFNETI